MMTVATDPYQLANLRTAITRKSKRLIADNIADWIFKTCMSEARAATACQDS
jgi:hypothetical protein